MQINATLIGQAIVFLILIWFTWKFIWPPLLNAIEERQKKIADGLAAADRGQKDLEDAKARSEVFVKEAREKAAEIIEHANRRGVELVEEAKQAAGAEGERIVTAARAEVSGERTKARDELRREVGQLAVAGAARLLGREVDARTHADLLEQLAAEIERKKG